MKQVTKADRLTLRWTIGNVRRRGFELLRVSIASAFRRFGPLACYRRASLPFPDAEISDLAA